MSNPPTHLPRPTTHPHARAACEPASEALHMQGAPRPAEPPGVSGEGRREGAGRRGACSAPTHPPTHPCPPTLCAHLTNSPTHPRAGTMMGRCVPCWRGTPKSAAAAASTCEQGRFPWTCPRPATQTGAWGLVCAWECVLLHFVAGGGGRHLRGVRAFVVCLLARVQRATHPHHPPPHTPSLPLSLSLTHTHTHPLLLMRAGRGWGWATSLGQSRWITSGSCAPRPCATAPPALASC